MDKSKSKFPTITTKAENCLDQFANTKDPEHLINAIREDLSVLGHPYLLLQIAAWQAVILSSRDNEDVDKAKKCLSRIGKALIPKVHRKRGRKTSPVVNILKNGQLKDLFWCVEYHILLKQLGHALKKRYRNPAAKRLDIEKYLSRFPTFKENPPTDAFLKKLMEIPNHEKARYLLALFIERREKIEVNPSTLRKIISEADTNPFDTCEILQALTPDNR